jgi:hypothetical protein
MKSGGASGGEAKATGGGASVRTNGDAAWEKRGSTGASAGGGGEGFCSVIRPGY